MTTVEARRLEEDSRHLKNWKRWGPYLSERQWATVREDYSPDGNLWESLPYEHSLARAYRWGEDGLLGLTDRECRLCFALALWNGKDPHLKERLFGLTNPEGVVHPPLPVEGSVLDGVVTAVVAVRAGLRSLNHPQNERDDGSRRPCL